MKRAPVRDVPSADLHTHSTASDGALTPAALVARAAAAGVELLALTDHDTVAGLVGLEAPAGLELVSGIELSARWEASSVHVVGLNFDLQAGSLREAGRCQAAARRQRAERIAERLRPLGLDDALGAAERAAAGAPVGRPHFAAALVAAGVVADVPEAFRRYLGRGKRGDVGHFWPPLATVIGWIRDAGGTAVLAHPLKYGLTRRRLVRLVSAFQAAGGTAIEVVSGRQTADQTALLTRLSGERGLAASCGSDFHAPAPYGADVGGASPLPAGVVPVWSRW